MSSCRFNTVINIAYAYVRDIFTNICHFMYFKYNVRYRIMRYKHASGDQIGSIHISTVYRQIIYSK